MRSRLAAVTVVLAAAGALSGCGSSEGTSPVPSQATPPGPTQAQLSYRQKLLAELRSGTYGDCECNADERAKERVDDGRAQPPPADGTVLQP